MNGAPPRIDTPYQRDLKWRFAGRAPWIVTDCPKCGDREIYACTRDGVIETRIGMLCTTAEACRERLREMCARVKVPPPTSVPLVPRRRA